MSTSVLSLILPVIAFAQTGSNGSADCAANTICNPLKTASVTGILNLVVDVAIPVGAIIAVLMFIFVGFKFIAAQGKADKLTEAWNWFKYVAIGTAILIGARVIIAIITSTLTAAGVVQPGIFNQ